MRPMKWKIKVTYYDKSRIGCCDTEWFIRTYAPTHLLKGEEYVQVNVFTCDIGFEIRKPWNDPLGEYTYKHVRFYDMFEFFTS